MIKGEALKKVASILSILSSSLLLVKWFAPSEVNNKRVEFLLCIIRDGTPELFFLLLVCLLYLAIQRKIIKIRFEWPLSIRVYENKIILDFTSNKYSRSLAVILFVFMVFSFKSIHDLLRARIYHYEHIYSAHKFNYYTKICDRLSSGNFIDALHYTKEIIKIYPDEEWNLWMLKSNLQNRIILSQKIYPLENAFIKRHQLDSSRTYDRLKFLEIQNAYILNPDKKYRKELLRIQSQIIKDLAKVDQLYDLSDKNQKEVLSKFIIQNEWFLLDKFITNDLRNAKKSTVEYVLELQKKYSRDELKQIISDSWTVDQSRKIIGWGDNLDIYVSENY